MHLVQEVLLDRSRESVTYDEEDLYAFFLINYNRNKLNKVNNQSKNSSTTSK
jgi:hypothetical protein